MRKREASGFASLLLCLNALEEDKEPGVIINVFEMKILQAAGYGPEFDSCVICGAEKPDDQLLVSPRLGGALCRSCKHNDPPAMEISARALKLLRLFARLDLTRLGNVDVKESSRDELKKLCTFMDVQLGLKLKSQSFLDQLDKYKI